ncbi:related to monophenol monooxygenase precursor (tyrosinase precursor) [Rhynchosporium agropyri]|uniref:tyrosinase n=1 Tax=Rhynchosporium agropyri TaxID=914238 RepID=A0A1E1KU53_9HELO|nr:related to monophenol monooxygenase precursor (tyrosinase precursor) [Rhynchosporium agropyri]
MLRQLIAVLVLVASCFAITSDTRFTINGTHTGSKRQFGSPRPSRRNILDLQQDIPQWSLYVQSLNALQDKPEDYFLSYFQIAGIHGRPYFPWGGSAQTPGAPTTGYCTHSSPLFLPWHRPYLALFEQLLGATAQDLVKTYPPAQQASYQNAANNFRIPYWDWASTPTMPAVLNQPTVTITTGAGLKNVRNPLYRYNFHTFPLNATYFPTDSRKEGDAWLAKYPYTVRGAPNQLNSPSDPRAVDNALLASNLKSGTYYALVKPTSFNEFGTIASPGTSLEYIHNSVHGAIGLAGGHMSILAYSAFDPVFWLHHVNVDRLFALYQAINPDQYLTPQKEQYGTFTLMPNSVDTELTLLQPFAPTGAGPYFTSKSVRQTSSFGYTYPEIQDWSQSPEQLKANVSAAINQLYRPSGTNVNPRFGELESRTQAQKKKAIEWSVGIKVSKFDLGGERFIIRVFLDTVPKDPKDWMAASSCVGSFPVFPPPHSAGVPYPEIDAYSELSLVEGLAHLGRDATDVYEVRKFLRRALQWRVQKFDGTVLPVENIPSLIIKVQMESVEMGRDITELPSYGKKTLHPDITIGRAGGYAGSE